MKRTVLNNRGGNTSPRLNENTKITLTVKQLRRLVNESRVEQCNESVQGMIGISMLASLLAVGSIVRADDLRDSIKPGANTEQVQKAINSVGVKTYGGFSAAQATNIVMRTIYQEGKGESALGRKMIATVIWNRAGGDPARFPGVCLKKFQFSVWNALGNRTPSGVAVKIPSGVTSPGQKQDIWNDCRDLVESMFDGTFTPEGDYNAYLNKDKASQSAVDGWGTDMTNQIKVGRHTFGYLPEHDGFDDQKATAKTQYPSTYKVRAGDLGVSYIARDLIRAGKTRYSNVQDLTKAIIRINSFRNDKKGNPIIRPGDVIKLPAWERTIPLDEAQLNEHFGRGKYSRYFYCDECGKNMVTAPRDQYVMIDDDIWRRVCRIGEPKLTWNEDDLCRDCIERRLGRPLTIDDLGSYRDAHINDEFKNPLGKNRSRSVVESNG